MGKHSSISGIDFNFDRHYQSGYKRNSNLDTYPRHSVDVFDLNFSDFFEYMGYRRIDDLLLTIGSDKGTSKPLVENDNEYATEENGAAEEEKAAEVFDRLELD
ncbi:hypothetical protein PVK06_048204 [Gossypium arboreum]|uniref:Uncharacterized protein n=1 Tax=Gossypium arboreum TaxID=29729 RepID=A0ABR0MFS1_GOSAR|nr:hypothetical protein PVK06_048204 [Gossypium arboreum]